jgi:hypothetical protein
MFSSKAARQLSANLMELLVRNKLSFRLFCGKEVNWQNDLFISHLSRWQISKTELQPQKIYQGYHSAKLRNYNYTIRT